MVRVSPPVLPPVAYQIRPVRFQGNATSLQPAPSPKKLSRSRIRRYLSRAFLLPAALWLGFSNHPARNTKLNTTIALGQQSGHLFPLEKNLWAPGFLKHLQQEQRDHRLPAGPLPPETLQKAYQTWTQNHAEKSFLQGDLFRYQYYALAQAIDDPGEDTQVSEGDIAAARKIVPQMEMEYLFHTFMNSNRQSAPEKVPVPSVANNLKPVDLKLFRFSKISDKDKKQLLTALALLNQDPEGRLLLHEIQRRDIGFTLVPVFRDGRVGGNYNPTLNQIELRPDQLITPRRVLFMIVHEMVHAITPENDDSLLEEGIANALAGRLQDRLFSDGKNSQGNLFQTFKEFTGKSLYQERIKDGQLPYWNDIVHRLFQLGFRQPQYE